jgi:2-polyprenyl-3-methyl-5-hydroxy-6-metoxy-1,4-benzoquinol methylase
MEHINSIKPTVESLQKRAAEIFEAVNALELEMQKKLAEIKGAEGSIQVQLASILATLVKYNVALKEESETDSSELSLQSDTQPVSQPEPAQNVSQFEEIRRLLISDQWPPAVNEILICDLDSEEDKDSRADGIVAAMLEEANLSDKKFLDFGCGEGHVVHKMAEKVSAAVGYDIVKSPTDRFIWEQSTMAGRMLLTTDFQKVANTAPYDLVLLYDVLEHVGNPSQVLKQAAEVLVPGGKMKLRFHPWCSRHGANLYRQINKAFVHLIFTDEELKIMGYEPKAVQRVLYPILTYRRWIAAAGLKILEEFPERSTVEDFFKNQVLISKRIKQHWNSSTFPIVQTEQSFVEYTVTK